MDVHTALFVCVAQFWVHTTVIRRLGVLEYILMTPSHHRVHHDRRVHRNYGGVLIIWDRLFGSFVDETQLPPDDSALTNAVVPDGDERVVYGILQAPTSWSPWTVQFHHLQDIIERCWRARGLVEMWNVLYRGPGAWCSVACGVSCRLCLNGLRVLLRRHAPTDDPSAPP